MADVGFVREKGVISSQIRLQSVDASLRGTGTNYFWEIPRVTLDLFSSFLLFFLFPTTLLSALCPSDPAGLQHSHSWLWRCQEQQTLALVPRTMIHIHNSLSSTNRVVTSKWLPRSSPMPGHCPVWGVPKPCWWPHGLGSVGAGLVPRLMTGSGSGLSIRIFLGV